MKIARIEPGRRLSQCVVHGDTVYTAGIVTDNPKLDIKGQTEDVLRKLDLLLKQAGTGKAKLLTATIYLPDMKNFQTMNSVWDQWVDPANLPARATVGAALAAPEYLVEIAVVAAL
jgi:enamine deaminase RidA (YjgF/YER057c/UK114 family)